MRVLSKLLHSSKRVRESHLQMQEQMSTRTGGKQELCSCAVLVLMCDVCDWNYRVHKMLTSARSSSSSLSLPLSEHWNQIYRDGSVCMFEVDGGGTIAQVTQTSLSPSLTASHSLALSLSLSSPHFQGSICTQSMLPGKAIPRPQDALL